jgi:trans-aconitate methyltransferase
MHCEAYNALTRMLDTFSVYRAHRYEVLDVGGRLVNDSIRRLLPNAVWTGVDIKPGDHVDIVADATTWKPVQTYDIVFCTEVLEHVENWRGILATCAAAVSPTGQLFVTCASEGRPPHGAEGTEVVQPGEYYGNVDVAQLAVYMRDYFRIVHVTYSFPPGDAYAYATSRRLRHRPGLSS